MSQVIDSNILIYYLNAALDAETKLFVEKAAQTGGYISVISRIEILGWPQQSAESLAAAHALLAQFKE